MPSLAESIVARLAAVSAVTSVVSTRIRPGRPSQSDTLPALYFEFTGNRRDHYLANATGTNSTIADATVQFTGLAYSRASCESIKQAVETALDGYAGTVSSVQILRAAQEDDSDDVLDAVPGTDRAVYSVQLDYRFRYRITPVTF